MRLLYRCRFLLIGFTFSMLLQVLIRSVAMPGHSVRPFVLIAGIGTALIIVGWLFGREESK